MEDGAGWPSGGQESLPRFIELKLIESLPESTQQTLNFLVALTDAATSISQRESGMAGCVETTLRTDPLVDSAERTQSATEEGSLEGAH